MIEPNAKLVTFLSQLAAARSDMDADYQRFTRLQTFLLICSLFVGRLAAGNLPLFACVFLRSLYTLYIADYYISSLLVVAAGFVSRSFLWGIRGQDGNALRVSHGGPAPVCWSLCCYRLHLPGGGDGGRVGLRRSDGVRGCRAVGTSCASSGTGSDQAGLLHNTGHGEVEKREEENYPGGAGGTKE